MAYLSRIILSKEDLSPIMSLYNISDVDLLISPARKEPIPECRQACFLAMRKCGYTVVEIADFFHRDHSTIVQGVAKIQGYIDSYPKQYAPLLAVLDHLTKT